MNWLFIIAIGLFLAVPRAWSADLHSLKFKFSPDKTGSGWRQVAPTTVFTSKLGYGYDFQSVVEMTDAVNRNLATNQPTAFFSVALPEGNYTVTMTFGDRLGGSTNTVKAESRRLMLERVVTAPGQLVTRSFTVNTRTPKINGRESVKLKTREHGVLHWDDKLTLEFNGACPRVCSLEIAPADDAITVFLAGDSTVTDQPREPWNSWGQMLTRFFKPGIAVANHAESGESIKSSLGARRFEKIFSRMKPGDYLFIQFGHNDQKDKAPDALAIYQANLKRLVAEARRKGGNPVLLTSMERKSGANRNTLAGYPDAMRQVAREESVPLIDLQPMSQKLYAALGNNVDKAFQDGTHHNAYGSYEIARCIAEGIRQLKIPLASHLTDDLAPFDPNQPDPVETFAVPPSPGTSAIKPEGN